MNPKKPLIFVVAENKRNADIWIGQQFFGDKKYVQYIPEGKVREHLEGTINPIVIITSSGFKYRTDLYEIRQFLAERTRYAEAPETT